MERILPSLRIQLRAASKFVDMRQVATRDRSVDLALSEEPILQFMPAFKAPVLGHEVCGFRDHCLSLLHSQCCGSHGLSYHRANSRGCEGVRSKDQQRKDLTVIDEHTWKGLALDVAGGMRSGQVLEVLSKFVSIHGAPRYPRSKILETDSC
jgi:hypothetical protein